MLLATIGVFFRDIEYLWSVALMMIMYTCAIFYYPSKLLKSGWAWILKFNPAVLHHPDFPFRNFRKAYVSAICIICSGIQRYDHHCGRNLLPKKAGSVYSLYLRRNMSQNAIEVNDVSMKFNLSREKVDSLKDYIFKAIKGELQYNEFWALRDINFSVEKGDRVGILGLNGAGKVPFLR